MNVRKFKFARRIVFFLMILFPMLVVLTAGLTETSAAQQKSLEKGSDAHQQLGTPGTESNRLSQKIENLKADGYKFKTMKLFMDKPTPATSRSSLKGLLTAGSVVKINSKEIKNFLKKPVKHFTLPIPHGQLELVEVDYSGMQVVGPKGEDLSWTNTARHYQGVVKGESKSLAAVSIFKNLKTGKFEIAGIFSTPTAGNGMIGRMEGDNQSEDHLVYLESSMVSKPPTVACGLTEDELLMGPPTDYFNKKYESHFHEEKEETPPAPSQPAAVAGACVRVHVEVLNDVCSYQGSNTTNYVTGFFNIAKTVYANESIPIELHHLKLWTSPGPEYNVSGYSNIWNAFWNRMYSEGIVGDIAMEIGYKVDRGIAALNPICGIDYNQCGVSPIQDYPSYPTYSWASVTFPHEMGHLMGCQHTQACVWNGNNTALDGCVAPEGSCSQPSSTYGTIMSYCSNFPLSNGFGSQPGNVVRSNFNNASCLVACGGSSCTFSISPSSDSFSASGGSGTVSVSTNSGCSWTASSNVSWISITSGSSGSSSGTVYYSVSQNSSSSSRTGTMYIAENTFTVSQSGSGGGGDALSNGVPISVSGSSGSETTYYIDVPSGASNLVMQISGGSGDADLYTRYGSAPTQASYDCRPYKSGNNETCSVSSPNSGRYYIMLHGYSSYSGATLEASFSNSSGTAPSINSHPSNQTVAEGERATFSVSASGTSPLSYQWYRNNSSVSGATSSSYTTSTLSASNDGDQYYVRVSNSYGSVNSNSATLTVTTGGGSNELTNGSPITVSGSSGSETMYFIDVPAGASNLVMQLSGGSGDADIYTRFGAEPTQSSYDCRPYKSGNNETCSVSSPNEGRYYIMLHGYSSYSNATLEASFDTSSGSAPTITSQPSNRTVSSGQTATFSVSASGSSPLSYQWYRNSSTISGANSSSYTTPSVSSSDNGDTFYVRVSNSYGSVYSNTVTLTVSSSGTAPSITSHPQSQTVNEGTSATFSVSASGSSPLSYQWYRNGSSISGATSSSYTLSSVSTSNDGDTFYVRVSNSYGSVNSNTATLTVSGGSQTLSLNLQISVSSGSATCNPNTTGAVRVDYWVYGGSQASMTSYPFTYVINTSSMSSGSTKWVYARAYDSSGNYVDSGWKSFTVQ